MMYKCADCGHVFEEGEQAIWCEDRGEFWGMPCTERLEGCPKCHGCFEEATECKECGELFLSDELYDGLCEDCQEELFD